MKGLFYAVASLTTLATAAIASPVSSISNNTDHLASRMKLPDTVYCSRGDSERDGDDESIIPAQVITDTLDWGMKLQHPRLGLQYPENADLNHININDCKNSKATVMVIPIFSDGNLIYRSSEKPGEDWLVFNLKGQICNIVTTRGTPQGQYKDCEVDEWLTAPSASILENRMSLVPRMDTPNWVWCTPSADASMQDNPIITGAQVDAALVDAIKLQNPFSQMFLHWPRNFQISSIGVHDCLRSNSEVRYFPIFPHDVVYSDLVRFGKKWPKDDELMDFVVHTKDGQLCNFITRRGMPKDRYQLCEVPNWDQTPWQEENREVGSA